jgi:protein-S-isoprenylcysteine O-methyltransferase Ste14
MSMRDRGPDVPVLPPVLFGTGILVGLALEHGVRSLAILARGDGRGTIAGLVLLAAGVALVVAGAGTFRRARTGIHPRTPATSIVTTGPYRLTRNPMYVGMTLVTLGVALLANTAWILATLPIVLALLVRLVIRREEAYLRRTFPAEYGAYAARVRRWL